MLSMDSVPTGLLCVAEPYIMIKGGLNLSYLNIVGRPRWTPQRHIGVESSHIPQPHISAAAVGMTFI